MDYKRLLFRISDHRYNLENTPTNEVDKLVENLKFQYKFIIERRFGDKPMSLKAISEFYPRTVPTIDGKMVGCTPERIRQMEYKGLRILRDKIIRGGVWKKNT